MSGGAVVAVVGAGLATAWAALLSLADGALAADPALAETSLSGAYAEKPERFRRALALGRIVFLALAAVGASGALAGHLEGFPATALVLSAVVVLVAALGDLGPRALGLWRGSALGASAVRTAAASLGILVPVIVAAGIVDRALARLFGVASRGAPAAPDPAQRDMLLGVFALADTMVSEVMTPRVDLTGVDCARPFAETVAAVAGAEHARLPAYDGDLDHIVGVLYAKDLLPALFGGDAEAQRAWRSLVRPVDIVPETKTLDAQLRDFQRGPNHLAVVVDEFGGTAGIVTLEDVLEEIVGEIRDEYDASEQPEIAALPDGAFLVDGRASLDALSEALGAPFAHEEVTTVGGLVYSAIGRVPVAGERLELNGWRVVVDQVVKRSIRRLRFERAAP
ncbi:MAG TPA: hemolysin family protein [Gemmatimonadales bacterium]|nr:hemolysin family protein [Gemmatimonadales bacterium]